MSIHSSILAWRILRTDFCLFALFFCFRYVKSSIFPTTFFSKQLDASVNGTPLQYSCLENPMDGEAQWAAVHAVAKSQTRLNDFTFMHQRRKWQPTPVFLPGESQGRGSLVGCHLWGRTESDTTEATQQQQQHTMLLKILASIWNFGTHDIY